MISNKIIEELYLHAEAEYPFECCGYIKKNGNVIRAINALSIDEAKAMNYRYPEEGYLFDENSALEMNASFKTDNPCLYIYHSHPNVGAYFSDEDKNKALISGLPIYPVDYIVIDVQKTGAKELKIYSYCNKSNTYIEKQTIRRKKDDSNT